MVTYRGNCPRTVSNVGKYHLRRQSNRWRIQLDYRSDGDTIRSSAVGHRELIDLLIAGRRRAGGGFPGGAFYINEYSQVLLPGRSGNPYSNVGEYRHLIEFEIEGTIISAAGAGSPPRAPRVGDVWRGPRHGIPYTLRNVSGNLDIQYESHLQGTDVEVIRLIDHCETTRCNQLGESIRAVKGTTGKFYVNEQQHMFAPRQNDEEEWDMVYVGELDMASGWFPKPGNHR